MKMIEIGKSMNMSIVFHFGSLEHRDSRSSVWHQVIEREEGGNIL